jgi:hypothetical protein
LSSLYTPEAAFKGFHILRRDFAHYDILQSANWRGITHTHTRAYRSWWQFLKQQQQQQQRF